MKQNETKEQTQGTATAAQPDMVEDTGLALDQYPSTIRAVLLELHAARQRQPKLYDARKNAEDILRAVIHEHYSNEKARDSAFRMQKESDSDFATANAAEQHGLAVIADLEAEVEELRGLFAVAVLRTWADVGSVTLKPITMALRFGPEIAAIAES